MPVLTSAVNEINVGGLGEFYYCRGIAVPKTLPNLALSKTQVFDWIQ